MTHLSMEQLGIAPELATLALLEAAANTAALALIAVFPEIQDLDDEDDDGAELRAALDVIDKARAVALSVKRYRRALLLAQERHDPTPF